MATYHTCDFCSRVAEVVRVTIEEKHPHNGSLYTTHRDCCMQCLKRMKEIVVVVQT
jgi:hypothetical protein